MAERKYKVLGIPVSEELYNEYLWSGKEYEVNGQKYVIFAVQELARNDKGEFDEKTVRGAREVIKNVTREIQRKMNKEATHMATNHGDFKGYFLDAHQIFSDYLTRVENIENDQKRELDARTREMEEAKAIKDSKRMQVADLELRALKERRSLKERDALDEMREALGEVRKSLDSHLRTFYLATVENVDRDALDILNSGILTDDEVVNMAEKYRDNVTMLRYIGKHAREAAENAKGENKTMLVLGHTLSKGNLSDGSKELQFFDRFCQNIERAISLGGSNKNNGLAINIGNFCNGYIEELDAMPAKPMSAEN